VVRLSSTAAVLQALHRARQVTFSSYILHPGDVENALVAAAKRGARVHVRLDGDLFGGSAQMHKDNVNAVKALRSAGADAKLVHMTDAEGPSLHMKAAVCDGVAFLDDANWNGWNDMVIRDTDSAHVRAIRRAALQNDHAPVGTLSLTKKDALLSEARVIGHAKRGDVVDVETEELHACAVTSALRKAAGAGARCRVLVSEFAARKDPGTQASAASLKKAGIDVRMVRSSEKLAVTAGSRAWIGCADATSIYRNEGRIEWSLTRVPPAVVHAVRKRFDAHWDASAPLPAAKPSVKATEKAPER
jgi:hypothetical protein